MIFSSKVVAYYTYLRGIVMELIA